MISIAIVIVCGIVLFMLDVIVFVIVFIIVAIVVIANGNLPLLFVKI